jgi:hypothetical protein
MISILFIEVQGKDLSEFLYLLLDRQDSRLYVAN